MAYTTIDNPELFFQTVLWTGNQSTQAITFDGSEDMQPDFVWIKQRSDDNYSHELFDSVRGVTKYVVADTNLAEATGSTTLTAFGSNGFTLGADTIVNKNTKTMVSWNWKAGTAFSNDASATSVGSIDSAGSVSTDAGIGIIRYGGTGSQGTLAHGLGVAPATIWFKRLDDNGAWAIYHQGIGATKYLRFDTDAAEITASDEFNDTAPSSTVFTVDTDGGVNASGTNNMIAYCFAEKQGYSKFGHYTGNANADGPSIFLGFKPAFLMVKRYGNTGNWQIVDNKRVGYNVDNNALFPDIGNNEDTGDVVDLLSTGFKIRSSTGTWNAASDYVYWAFAESPFINSKGIPNNAR